MNIKVYFIKIYFIAIFLMLLLSTGQDQLRACDVFGKNLDMDIMVSIAKENYRYNYNGSASELEIRNCADFNDGNLIITNDLVFTNMGFTEEAISRNSKPIDRCEFDKSPFDISSPKDPKILQLLTDQKKILDRCLQYEITDQRGTLDYVKEQEDCLILRTDGNKALVQGARCIFKINTESHFVIRYHLNPSCVKKDPLGENLIDPMEVKARLSIMTASSLWDSDVDYYDLKGSGEVRITFLPDQDLMPVSTSNADELTRYPTTYGVQVALGAPEFRDFKESTILRLPFLVNNNCSEVCKEGVCSSPCNFKVPVVAAITLKRRRANENSFKFVDFWYQGGVVPPRFIGKLPLSHTIKGSKMRQGDQYQIEATFTSPSTSYQILRNVHNEVNSLLIEQGKIDISTAAIGYKIPILPDIGDLGSIGISIDNLLNENDDIWPPYYDQACYQNRCEKAQSNFLTLALDLEIKSITAFGEAKLTNMVLTRRSKIYGDQKEAIDSFPQIICRRPYWP